MIVAGIVENVITMMLACGLFTLFYYWTKSPLSFLWLMLLLNLNSFRNSRDK